MIGTLLAGCASSPSGGVQVVDRNSAAAQRQPVTSGQYRVQRGDTLYSIAFRYGWDWKALASHNGIAAPYLIRVGQVIRFDRGAPSRPAVASRPTVTAPVVTTPSRPSTPVQAPPAQTTTQPATPVVVTPATTPVQTVQRSATGWAWPANGAIIGRFSSNGSLNKGIDIAGELGQPVLAASGGSVVYAGSGLRGYGELVIIKHSDTYVSAYGHNRRLLVKEGQQVKVGQQIAEMGSTGTDRVKLHFEIRRQGKPVDPMQYLPRR
ncbi:peptigoglycan-binding protein LysM [Pseudomonas daroniae]|uniref:Peptigoglycan-binding protein LysM n=1 Tax=Phytopseudomonas daroniae TaxID=2487519 RepID=A0A4V2KAM0_9GAMM|nr:MULTISPECIES: peptidoglycan DD-metalloendopeptidase family protein [Pseudomonas]TBU77717.1 peptigoglycan-binding protein LysM [Pseudomonas daroniae]TBU79110.1 peptigoglycan-binding protein LysM [Pseudomonas daroniae]TBU86167.1 peptigoglycan-binding protein LysM [Pseudomonas sp. FRB 228]TBU95331.1 peptigoglycan-binding protein LysM [Pseudomonas daroniae]